MPDTAKVFRPEYPAPGGNLKDILDDRGIKVVGFARRCGRPTKTISKIISGDTAITPETALQFQHVLGSPTAEMWLNWEVSYRLKLAAQKEDTDLTQLYSWAKSFPWKELVDRGLVKSTENKIDFVKGILSFFGISSLIGWEKLNLGQERTVSFRKAKKHLGKESAIATWLRIGDIKAAEIETEKYDEFFLEQYCQISNP